MFSYESNWAFGVSNSLLTNALLKNENRIRDEVDDETAHVHITVNGSNEGSYRDKAEMEASIQTIIQYLGGALVESVVRLPAKIKSGVSPSNRTVVSYTDEASVVALRREPSDNQHQLIREVRWQERHFPQSLVIAILDDNVLSRRFLVRFCQNHLKCSVDSFAMGSSLKETLAFIDEILKRSPSLVIFDQHLEHAEDEYKIILGTDLAKLARAKGYQGAIVIHTANDQVLETLDFSIVDGGIAKTLSTKRLIEGFQAAWQRYLERMDRAYD